MPAVSKRRPARKELEALIRDTGGNVTKLAERLGCSRETAYRWIYQLRLERVVGIDPEPKAPVKGEAVLPPPPPVVKVQTSAHSPAPPDTVHVSLQLPRPIKEWLEETALRRKHERRESKTSMAAVLVELVELAMAGKGK